VANIDGFHCKKVNLSMYTPERHTGETDVQLPSFLILTLNGD